MGIYHVDGTQVLTLFGPAKADVVGDQGFITQIEQPTVSALAPDTAACGDPDLQLIVTGTGFNEASRIVFNGFDEPTALLSPTQVRTNVKPSLFAVPVALPVAVRTGQMVSEPLDFTFTEAGGTRGAKRR